MQQDRSDDQIDATKSCLNEVLGMVGFQLSDHSSKLSRELRNPFTSLGGTCSVHLPIDITTEIHAFAGQALVALSKQLPEYFTRKIIICSGQFVLWSTLSHEDTAAVHAFLWTDLLPTGSQVEFDKKS